ncbi:MAG: hypothetical protein M3256_05505 [Actinomycetota bacterium]|nr:hypothetical protein [Actinomycetota bacterium]
MPDRVSGAAPAVLTGLLLTAAIGLGVADPPDGCPKCGADGTFHRFGCVFVLLPLSIATLAVGAIIAATVALGRDEQRPGFDLGGLIGVFVLLPSLLLLWFLLGKIRRIP